MNYYISDTHFGHDNIIKHSKRPFCDAAEMDREIIKRWNNAVTNKDDIYFLGDFCFKSGNSPKEYFDRLNGKFHIILGNHDKPIKNFKHNKIVEKSMYLDINDNGRRVILFHYPITEWNGYFRDSYHLYGHIHNNTENEAYKIMRNIPNAYNVGADILDFAPRTLDEVIEYNKLFNEEHN